ncbi:MAG: response regulator transcription factor [Fibrobacteria bacterium]|nr:response regulator transcription factor [Fibrobacteria bacterium]
MHKILIVEDEDAIRLGLVDILEMEGYQINEAVDGEEAIQIAQTWNPDLVLLDLMLPKLNGLEVCRHLRKKQPDIFILMLTAKTEDIDKLSGFKMGADDYMTKPFSTMVLLARIKSMLRRSSQAKSPSDDLFTFGDISIDFKKYEAKKADCDLELSAKEFQILKYFSDRIGEVVQRTDLLQSIWGYTVDNMPTTRTVDNQIAKLRQKIEEDLSHPAFIKSVRGVGYKFELGDN